MSVNEVLCGGESLDFCGFEGVDRGVSRNDAVDVLGILGDKASPAGVYRLEGRLNNAKESCGGGEFSTVGWETFGDEGEARETPNRVRIEGNALSEFRTYGCEPVVMRA